MPAPETTSTKPTERPAKRHRFRFTIRSLLVVTALCAVWIANQTYRARQQASAVKTLKRLGGAVHFDYQVDSAGQHVPNAEPAAPKWLRSTIGEDYFRTVVTADIAISTFRKKNTSPEAIDVALSAIACLPELTVLELGGNSLIDDAAVRKIANLGNLKTLYLYKTSVRGAGLSAFYCANLTGLHLGGAQIDDAGLACLKSFPNLKWLRLSGTKITDAGLKQLQSLKSLDNLSIDNTDVSDRGLEHLDALPNLREVWANRTQITNSGVAAFQAAHPQCQISPTIETLERKPIDYVFWKPGIKPTSEELIAAMKELRGTCNTTNGTPQTAVSEIVLMDSNISDESLANFLKELPELQSSNLRHLLVGDRFAESLPRCPKLRFLALDDTCITDAALSYVAKLPQLAELSLNETRVSDSGLLQLEQATQLKSLHLSSTRVTPAGVERLRKALPGCAISY